MACPRRDALRDRDGAVQMWRRGRWRRDAVATAGWWRFPSLQHIPDRLGFLLVGQRATIFGLFATDPHLFLLYVCCATGAHQPSTGWAPPIRAQVKARLVRWAQTVEINTNTVCKRKQSSIYIALPAVTYNHKALETFSIVIIQFM